MTMSYNQRRIAFKYLFDSGYLRHNLVYRYHYFISKLHFNISVDIGACFGSFTHILSKNSTMVVVHEPNKPAFKSLQKGFNDKDNIILSMLPIPTNADMTCPGTKVSVIRTHPYGSGRFSAIIDINGKLPLDYIWSCFDDFSEIDFIKIDVEGGEDFIINKVFDKADFHNKYPMILCKIGYGAKKDTVKRASSIGYNPYVIIIGQTKLSNAPVEGLPLYEDTLFIHESSILKSRRELWR